MGSPTTFSSFEAADKLKEILVSKGFDPVIDFAFFFSTGLPGLEEIFDTKFTVSASELGIVPDCFRSTRFIAGRISGKTVLGVTRRPHFFENPSMAEICIPVNIIHAAGCRNLLLITTACSVKPDMHPGTFMIVRDHINLFGTNPLLSPACDRALDNIIGPKLISLRSVYSEERIMLLETLCIEADIPVCTGVYAGTAGPFTETSAEYTMLANAGADCVGMTLVPEAMQTAFLGMKFTAGVLITANAPSPGSSSTINSVDSEEMMSIESMAEKKIALTAKSFFAQESLI
jgi:purine-nucleoside phosphorylase